MFADFGPAAEQHWSAFTRAAALRLSPPDEPELMIPYILISSASASADYTSTERTERIDQTVETQLAGFSRVDLQRLFKALVDRDENRTLDSAFFIVLDAESAQEQEAGRKALMIERSFEYVDEQGQPDPEACSEHDGLRKLGLWRWHRVPFDKVWDNVALLTSQGRMMQEEEFLDEEIWVD